MPSCSWPAMSQMTVYVPAGRLTVNCPVLPGSTLSLVFLSSLMEILWGEGPAFLIINVTDPGATEDWSSAMAKSFSVALIVAPAPPPVVAGEAAAAVGDGAAAAGW